MSRADWSFDGTWPYSPRWFDSADGRMHYIDEGSRDGKPVVMVHGNSTWCYLYRNFVGPVVDGGYRAIVVDHLGFGPSEKPDDSELYLGSRFPVVQALTCSSRAVWLGQLGERIAVAGLGPRDEFGLHCFSYVSHDDLSRPSRYGHRPGQKLGGVAPSLPPQRCLHLQRPANPGLRVMKEK